MKLIHCADVHLGARLESKFPQEVSKTRKEEVRNSFKRMVEYAVENGVQVILLAGDIFDGDEYECPVCTSHDWDFLLKDCHGDIIGCQECVTKIYPGENI